MYSWICIYIFLVKGLKSEMKYGHQARHSLQLLMEECAMKFQVSQKHSTRFLPLALLLMLCTLTIPWQHSDDIFQYSFVLWWHLHTRYIVTM